jgi:hypothetical protein
MLEDFWICSCFILNELEELYLVDPLHLPVSPFGRVKDLRFGPTTTRPTIDAILFVALNYPNPLLLQLFINNNNIDINGIKAVRKRVVRRNRNVISRKKKLLVPLLVPMTT